MRRILLLLAAPLMVAGLTVVAPPAAAVEGGQVAHTCVGTGRLSNGMHGAVCTNAYIYPLGDRNVYAMKVEYICATDYAQVPCTGIKGLGIEYVSPYSWIGPAHREACGVYYTNLPCTDGRHVDNRIKSVAVYASQCHHWVGKAYNVTFNMRGVVVFIDSYRGFDLTTCPS